MIDETDETDEATPRGERAPRETRPEHVVPPARPLTDFPEIPWEELRERAVEMLAHAYVPYSGYQVGVAGVAEDGRILAGCNVENASLAVALCAECGMVSDLVRTGGGRLRAVVCVDAVGRALVPCGRCRQLLFEHGGRGLLLALDGGVRTLDQLLPLAFGPDHLAEASERRAAMSARYLADNPAPIPETPER